MEIERLYQRFKESSGVTTDSRTVKGGEIFFALKGENFDGNDYALRALEAGADFAVVQEGSAAADAGDPRLLVVPDTLKTLQDLARHHRDNVPVDGKRLTVIGLTGTNGKTTTKELITRVLSRKYEVTSTQGNLNNDIGVPLSLLRIGPGTQIAVIEMGASHPGDIESLVHVADPDFGLITNVGKAHLLGFGNFEGVKKTKGELYEHIHKKGGRIFLNVDDPVLSEMADRREGLSVIPYGFDHWGAMLLPSDASHPFVRLLLPDSLGSEDDGPSDCLLAVETHLTGAYNVSNIIAAISVGLHFGVSLDDAICAVESYVPVNNRSQLQKTAKNILIVDAYNANPTSMAAALDNLALVEAPRKVALLGEMRELGAESLAEHSAVLEKAMSLGLDLLCLVGEDFKAAAKASDKVIAPTADRTCGGVPALMCFKDSDSLALWLKENPLEGSTVLVKGSRGVRMERVLERL